MNKRQEVLNTYSLGLQMIQKNNKYSIIIKLKIMQQSNKQLVLLRDDYELLKSYLNGRYRKSAFDRRNAEELHSELKKARLVSKDAFPPDVVRLNSTVRIKTEGKDEITEWILVTPDEADIKERKIS